MLDIPQLPEELAIKTTLNVYLGYCVHSSQGRVSCTGDDLLNFLSQSDAWIQMGGVSGVNQTRLDATIAEILEPEIQRKLDLVIPPDGQINQLLQFDGYTPIKWGNYNYGTTGYLAIRGGIYPTIFCTLVQEIKTDKMGNEYPIDYIFTITSAENPPPFDTNYLPIGIPTWFTNRLTPAGAYVDCGIPWTPESQ